MDDEALISELPPMMAVALRLRSAGYDDDVIAVATAVPPQGVEALVELAEAKLARQRRLGAQKVEDAVAGVENVGVEKPVVDY